MADGKGKGWHIEVHVEAMNGFQKHFHARWLLLASKSEDYSGLLVFQGEDLLVMCSPFGRECIFEDYAILCMPSAKELPWFIRVINYIKTT